MNETLTFENFIIKSEYDNSNKIQKLSTNHLTLNQTQFKNIQDNDEDIIWIFDKYNEQKIDDNVFIDLTNDDHLNLLLDSNNLDLFQNTPTTCNTPSSPPVHQLSTITINEVKNEAKCVNQNLNFKCELCSKTFKKKFNYTRHVIIHKNEFPYRCNHCDKKFKDESNSKKHLQHCKMKLLVTNVVELPTSDKISSTKTNLKNSKFKCDMCEKEFYKKYNLTRHKNIHKLNDFKNNSCQYDYENSENNDVRYYECKICNKKFNELKQLNLHHKSYHIECEEIECSICKQRFNIKYDYLVHELACKNGEKSENKMNTKSYKCNICKKTFTKIYNLNRHLATRHQNKLKSDCLIKKHVCEYCSKSFYELNKLKSHSNTCKFANNKPLN
jgi:hypothetical protein